MKKKTVVASILTMAMCASLITGATFALFTDESKTNIAITSGTVDVEAELSIASIHTPTSIAENGVVVDATEKATLTDAYNGTFGLGGSVAIDEKGDVKITNMVPGDKVVFQLSMTNNSNVALMQREQVSCADEDKSFFESLNMGVSVDGVDYVYYHDYVSAWQSGADVYGEGTTATRYLSLELPAYVGNDMQGKTCNLTVSVNAVQGNAQTVDGTAKTVEMVGADEVASAINGANDGDVIYLTEPANTVDVDFTDTKEVVLRGYDIQTLNVDAPNGTLHVYNNVNAIYGENVAQHSLYVYGTVGNLVVNNGRVVVENTATVDKVELAPKTADAVVKLEAVGAPVVEKVVVNATAEATVVVATPENVENALPTVEYTADSAVQEVIKYVATSTEELASLIAEVAEGTTIFVNADVVDFPAISKKITLVSKNDTYVSRSGSIKTGVVGVVIDGFTFTNSVGYTTADITFQNCTFIGSNGLRWCYNTGVWNLKNCVFNTSVYGIHFDGNANSVVNIEGCTISGFNTIAQNINVNVKNSVFTKTDKTDYAVFQMRGITTITDCVIEASWGTAAGAQHFGNASNAATFEVYNTNYEGGNILDLSGKEGTVVIDPTKDADGKYTGGTFYKAPSAELLAEGYSATQNADGYYTVSK